MYRNIHICGKFLTKIIHPLKWVSELHVLENFLNVFETLLKLIYRLLNINDQYTDFLSQLFKEKDRLVIKIYSFRFSDTLPLKLFVQLGLIAAINWLANAGYFYETVIANMILSVILFFPDQSRYFINCEFE